MDTHLIKVIITLCVLCASVNIVNADVTCKAYEKKCFDENYVINRDLCYVSGNEGIGNQSVYTYYYGQCEKNSYCAKVSTKGQCVESFPLKQDGSQCNIGVECESGVCDMQTHKCVYLKDGDVCYDDAQCGRKSFCYSDLNSNTKKCIPLKKENEECYGDNYCDFNLACGTIDKSGVKKCAKMFSLKAGEMSDNMDLCEGGFFADYDNTTYCVDVIVTNKRCSFEDDNPCPTVYDFGNVTAKQEVHGMCHCKWNGDKVCKPSSNSNLWKQFISVYNNVVANLNVDNIHVATMRRKWWGSYDIIKARSDYADYLETHGTQQCVKSYYYSTVYHHNTNSGSYNTNYYYYYICLILLLFM